MTRKPEFQVNLADERLWRDGEPAPIPPKAFRLLRAFATRPPGKLLRKEDILAEVWPETHVSDASVKDCVKTLRDALGDDAGAPRFIETVHGRGYVYLGGVEVLDDDQLAPGGGENAPGGAGAVRPRVATGLLRASGAAALVLLAAGVYASLDRYPATWPSAAAIKVASARPVLAVQPFEAQTAGTRAELIAGALTREITSALARAPDLVVVDAATATRMREAPGPPETAIGHVLHGTVQESDGTLRLTATLTDARTGRYIWSRRYDRALSDVFALEDDIAQRVFAELRGELTEGDRARLAEHDTRNLDAWLLSHEAYGEYLKFERAANLRARELWTRTAAADPAHATALAGIALTHWADAKWGWSEGADESLRLATQWAEKAIATNPEEPLGRHALGTILFQMGRPEEALVERRKALALAPNDMSVVAGLAYRLNEYGRSREALELFERSLTLSPRPPGWVYLGHGVSLHLEGRADEAVAAFETARVSGGRRADVHARLAAAHADRGDLEGARREAAALLAETPDFSVDAFLATDGFRVDELNGRLRELMLASGLPP